MFASRSENIMQERKNDGTDKQLLFIGCEKDTGGFVEGSAALLVNIKPRNTNGSFKTLLLRKSE